MCLSWLEGGGRVEYDEAWEGGGGAGAAFTTERELDIVKFYRFTVRAASGLQNEKQRCSHRS
jgi:hypothetical protein